MNALAAALAVLTLDLETGRITRREWPEETVAYGSLDKPFTALAWGQKHGFHYPVIECKRCWLPQGHGRVGIVQAIAQSCNSYFDALQVSLEDRDGLAKRFGTAGLRAAAPEKMLRAYAELYARRHEPGVAQLLQGMRTGAAKGTSKLLGVDAYAKTGTAPCSHTPRAPGDGFVVVLEPAERPKRAWLVRLHGHPGSHAAREAGRLIRGKP